MCLGIQRVQFPIVLLLSELTVIPSSSLEIMGGPWDSEFEGSSKPNMI